MTYAMPPLSPPRNPFTPTDAPTLVDVLDRLDVADGINQRQRREMRSAIRKLGTVLNRPLTELPARAEFLRKRLKSVVPAAVGLTPSRWANVRSLLRKALEAAGFAVMPGRYQAPLTDAWLELFNRLPTRILQIGLSRLAHFGSANRIEPDDVTPATFELFREALDRESVLCDPRVVDRDARRCWNMARESVDGWPQVVVEVPNYRDWYTLDWSDFPPSLVAEVNAMLQAAQRTDPLVETNLPRIGAVTARDRRRDGTGSAGSAAPHRHGGGSERHCCRPASRHCRSCRCCRRRSDPPLLSRSIRPSAFNRLPPNRQAALDPGKALGRGRRCSSRQTDPLQEASQSRSQRLDAKEPGGAKFL